MRCARLAAAAVAVGATAACGVPVQDRPHPIDSPPRLTPRPPATADGVNRYAERLCLTHGGGLRAVVRAVPAAPTAQRVLADLLAGPSQAEAAQGLGSVVGPSTPVGDVRVAAGRATVTLTALPDQPSPGDEILAYGQIVCTLTSHAGVTEVVFTSNGRIAAVPAADASLPRRPLRAADYAELLR